MRFSLSPEDRKNTYQVFSLSAYDASIQIFKRLLEDTRRTAKSKSVLVVISLVFTLFEAVQQRPTQIYESGWAGHLKGALALMQRQGPGEFQTGALHEAFRKLREMAILYLLSTRQSSFLSHSEWMTIPWKKIQKTHRDQLYDIATKLTSIYSLLPPTTPGQSLPENHSTNLIWRCRQLDTDLMSWRTMWLTSQHPEFLAPSPSQTYQPTCNETKCTYFPDPRTFPTNTNEFSFLVAEWTALVLLLNNMICLLSGSSCSDSFTYPAPESLSTSTYTSTFSSTSESITRYTPLQLPLSSEIQHLQTYLHSVLKLPCFGYSPSRSDKVGITEGRCRSLLPNWVLSNVVLDRGESFAEEDGDCDVDQVLDQRNGSWWEGLSDRLNFGVF